MNYLVTGANGFLGREVVRQLLAAGHQVSGFDRSVQAAVEHGSYRYQQGDLADLPSLLECCRALAPEAIIHTAAISHPVDSLRIPLQTVMTNAVGTAHVLESARLSGVPRVVNLSSECAYGLNQALGVIDETAALAPTTPYGCTKVFTELLGDVYSKLYGVSVVSLRPGWIYGPGQVMQCYLKTLLRHAIDGTELDEPAGADYYFQYVHVSDVAAACIQAAKVAEGRLLQRVFNITAGDQRSYRAVAALVLERYPEAQFKLGSGTLDILDANARFDISAAAAQLDYQHHYSLESGIAMYADWLEMHPC